MSFYFNLILIYLFTISSICSGTFVIVKQQILKEYYEIVEVSIQLNTTFEEVDHQDIEIKSLTEYKYKLNPIAIKGLLFIETILWDTERFLKEHTTCERIEEEEPMEC